MTLRPRVRVHAAPSVHGAASCDNALRRQWRLAGSLVVSSDSLLQPSLITIHASALERISPIRAVLCRASGLANHSVSTHAVRLARTSSHASSMSSADLSGSRQSATSLANLIIAQSRVDGYTKSFAYADRRPLPTRRRLKGAGCDTRYIAQKTTSGV